MIHHWWVSNPQSRRGNSFTFNGHSVQVVRFEVKICSLPVFVGEKRQREYKLVCAGRTQDMALLVIFFFFFFLQVARKKDICHV